MLSRFGIEPPEIPLIRPFEEDAAVAAELGAALDIMRASRAPEPDPAQVIKATAVSWLRLAADCRDAAAVIGLGEVGERLYELAKVSTAIGLQLVALSIRLASACYRGIEVGPEEPRRGERAYERQPDRTGSIRRA